MENPNSFDALKSRAEQGYAYTQCKVADMYYQGRGVKQNYHLALHWYRQAAEQGLAIAQFNVGVMYKNGRGVNQDDHQALH